MQRVNHQSGALSSKSEPPPIASFSRVLSGTAALLVAAACNRPSPSEPAGAAGAQVADVSNQAAGSPTAPPPDVTIASWRAAILAKDSEAVLALDRAFVERPAIYGDALATSARGDTDDRVRAFSTRVLGKTKDPRWAKLFEQLLGDKSPYVRENAAWALNELAAGQTPSARADEKHGRAKPGLAASSPRTAVEAARSRNQGAR